MSGNNERRTGKAKAAPAAAGSQPEAGVDQDDLQAQETKAKVQWGAGVLAVMFTFGEAVEEDKRLSLAVQASKYFLLVVALVAPVLLLWQHLL